MRNVLGGLLPAKLLAKVLEQSGVDLVKKVHDTTKVDREKLVESLKGFSLHLTGLRPYKEAIITQGGVQVKEIDPSTMGSKKVQGLYFAGEVLDLDALTGGFNLQIAWSTGYVAGNAL